MDPEPIYIIDERVRQALISIIAKAVHPNVSFEQVDVIKQHLEKIQPVQVMQGPPAQEGAVAHMCGSYQGPDNNGCGEPGETPLEETGPV